MTNSNSYDYHAYSDLNCPFCFALNERFHNLSIDQSKIEWRGIQHEPDADSISTPATDVALIKNEVSMLRKRAPEISLITPPFRPNTKLPTSIIIQLQKMNMDQAIAFRTLVFRAYWRDGADISNRSILTELAKRLDITIPPIDDQTLEMMDLWQGQWENGDYGQRIPSMDSDKRGPLVGFANTPDLLFYLHNLEVEESTAIRMNQSC